MKTKELSCKDIMIGDWIKPKNVDVSFRVGLMGVDSVWNDTDTNEWDYDELEPIPLTAEILEKNGFEVTRNMSSSGNKDVWSLRVSNDKVFYIIEHHNKRQFPYFWIELGSNPDIKYVHQLQHALRLCGIEKEIEL